MILRSHRLSPLAALIAATLSLGACGDSDDDPMPVSGDDAGAGPMDVVDEAGPGGEGTAGGDGTDGAGTGSTDVDGTDADGTDTDGTDTDDADGGDVPVDGTPITDATLPDDVARRLERALALYRGEPIELGAAIAARFDAPGSGTVETNRAPADPAIGGGTTETVDYRCADGGTARSVDTVDASGLLRERRTEFTGCRVGAWDVTGSSRLGANPVPEGLVLPAPYTAEDLGTFHPNLDLRLTDSRDGGEIVLDGAQAYDAFPDPSSSNPPLVRNWASAGGPTTIVGGDGATTVATIAVGVTYLDDGAGQIGEVRSSGSVELSGDGGDGLRRIEAVEAFERDGADGRYATGTLEIDGDGFGYVLDAGNGDPDSFQLTVEADGATSSFTVPWSDRYELDAFRPSTVDLGFGG